MSMRPTGRARRLITRRLFERPRERRRRGRPPFVAAIVAAVIAFGAQRAEAQACLTTALPYTLTNGATADASQVMANLNCAAVYGLANWGGNVGIGTTTPSAPLDVGGNGYLHVAGTVNPTVTAQGAYLSWNATGGVGETDFINNKGGGPGGFYFVNSTALTTPLMFIAANGNVGIGTTSPPWKLTVIGSNPVFVLANSDFVGGTAGSSLAIQQGGPSGNVYSQIQALQVGGVDNAPLVLNPNGGSVGVGTTTPSSGLDVVYGNEALHLSNSGRYLYAGATTSYARIGGFSSAGPIPFVLQDAGGNVGIGTTSPAYPLYVNGQAAGTTSWLNTSDLRLKKNIVEITGALALVEKLRGVRFDWKTVQERAVGKTLKLPQGEHEMGFIAQDVAKVVPEAVATPKADKDGLYGVKEADLVPLLVEAIKEQQQEIAKLQSTVAALQQTISKPGH